MRLGFAVPQFGALANDGSAIARFAATAEELGAASLWAGDRLLAAVRPTVGYAGRDTIPAQFRAAFDPFVALTLAASVTHRLRLGTSVLVSPWYPPALLARLLTSLDIASNGRLVAGFGIGWSPEEYAAAGVPFVDRGGRLDEGLDALVALWTDDPAAHHGRYWEIPAAHPGLRPVQRPHPPIFLGGRSAAALGRVGRRGDGWLPSGIAGRLDPARLCAERAVIDDAARAAGRDPTGIGTVLRLNATEGTRVHTMAATLDAVRAGAAITDAFVDLLYVSSDVDEQLAIVEQLLGRVAG